MSDKNPSITDVKQKIATISNVSTLLETKKSEVEFLLTMCIKNFDFTQAVKENDGIFVFTTMFKNSNDFDLKTKLTILLLFLSLSGHKDAAAENLMSDINISSLVNLFLEKDFSIFIQAFNGLKVLASAPSCSASAPKSAISFNLPTAALFFESITTLIDPSSKMLSDTQKAEFLVSFAQFVKMGVMAQADAEAAKDTNTPASKNFSLAFGKFLKTLENCQKDDFSALDLISAQILMKAKEGKLINSAAALLGQSSDSLSIINNWLGGSKKFSLLYKAINDGFASSTFHSKCDYRGATVTIITSSEGHVFGGYAAVPWTGNTWCGDNTGQSFLFSLKNPRNAPPAKFSLTNSSYVIYAGNGYGPTFGSGSYHDIYCINNNTGDSYTYLGCSFANTTGLDGSTVFTGAHKFTAKDIEVYQVA